MIDATIFFADFKNEFIDPENITINEATEFRKIGSWDSLTGMAILVMIQDKYSTQFSDADFQSCTTAGDVLDRIMEYQK
jgi:acyl carrier protein